MLNKIKNWWNWYGRYYHKNFVYGIKNLWKWFPIIWKDRDWDDHYIWEMLKFKLSNQAKYIGDRDFHTLAKRDAEIMMTCVKLMDRIQNNYYGTEYLEHQKSNFEFVDIGNGLTQVEIKQISEDFDAYFKKYPNLYKQLKDWYTDKDTLAQHMSYENHERAKKLLFTLMERNIERWWE